MKTTRIFLLLAISLSAGLYSCELLDDQTDLSVAERLEGSWKVENETNPYKSTEDSYPVYIDISPVDSNTILISNFFQLGSDINAIAKISGMTLTLPNQTIGDGFRIYGSGTITDNYKKITWLYYADEGSGTYSQINSIYTKAAY